jgi:DEAD/DEAH box helicase domain-containing protein
MKIITFDLEIRKGFEEVPKGDYSAMGISLGAAYLHHADRYKIFSEENLDDLKKDFDAADLIVGFNILGFDIPLLKAVGQRVGVEFDISKDKVYDLFADIKYSLNNQYPKGWKLNNVAQSSLPFGKNGNGAEAPGLWQTGQIAKLATYVLQDVKVEKSLFDYALEYGYVKNNFTNPTKVELKLLSSVMDRIAAKAG